MIRNIYLPGIWKFPKINCDICFYQDVVDENGDISQVNMKHEWYHIQVDYGCQVDLLAG